jgi:hypothetical protein
MHRGLDLSISYLLLKLLSRMVVEGLEEDL